MEWSWGGERSRGDVRVGDGKEGREGKGSRWEERVA